MPILAKCSICGEPFERLFRFCPKCGQSVTGEGVPLHTSIRDLFEIARDFASVSDLDLLLQKISIAAEKLTHCEASSVMLLDEKKEFLYFKSAGGEKGQAIKTVKIPAGEGIAGSVAQTGKYLLIEDVAKEPRFSAALADEKIGFKTTSILCVPLLVSGEIIGVMEVLNKKGSPGGKFTSEDVDILGGLGSFAAVSIANSKLDQDQKNFFANTIEILIMAIESSGTRTPAGHCWRVAQTSCAIARRLKIEKSQFKKIYYASLLHDIGYIAAKRKLLAQKVIVTSDKLEAMHPLVGEEMVEAIHLLKESAALIRSHHEFWDGSGFPDKLKGDAIPLGARIISFVESLEDLWLPGMDEEEFQKKATQYASKNADVLFDPQVVSAYLQDLAAAKESYA
ncbi:MAG: GAF domain-containing protein [Elusimicrobia bacterium]|nr:GAF domain-containing protein [Elusimicrobiota bacterium]MBI3012518.1 GAF domain-containing protein [Elusimicrobiota bacterium]